MSRQDPPRRPRHGQDRRLAEIVTAAIAGLGRTHALQCQRDRPLARWTVLGRGVPCRYLDAARANAQHGRAGPPHPARHLPALARGRGRRVLRGAASPRAPARRERGAPAADDGARGQRLHGREHLPSLDRLPTDRFYEQAVPFHVAQAVFRNVQAPYPAYSYREPALNPTSLDDQRSHRRQSTTSARTSEERCARFSTVPVRSLNCLPYRQQRELRERWAVRSGPSVITTYPHSMHRILSAPDQGRPDTQVGSRLPGSLARALTT